MAEKVIPIRLLTAFEELREMFPGTSPLAEETDLFNKFEEICTRHKGEPFKALPESFAKNVRRNPSRIPYQRIHIAWFHTESVTEGFIAAIYRPKTGEYDLVHSHEGPPNWLAWLDEFSEHLANSVILNEIMSFHPTATLTKH